MLNSTSVNGQLTSTRDGLDPDAEPGNQQTSGEARLAGETKHEAFVRIAERRTNAVLAKLRILGNCANKYQYDWTDEDLRIIFSAIDDEVKQVRARFQQATRGPRQIKLR